MSYLHKEINFEADNCNHLAVNGWLYAEGDTASYDRGTLDVLRLLLGPARLWASLRERSL